MCEYPYQLCKTSKYSRLPRIKSRNFNATTQFNTEGYSQQLNSLSSKKSKKSVVLYKKKRRLGDEYYEIELLLSNNKLILNANNLSNDTLTAIKIPKDKSTTSHYYHRQTNIGGV